MRSSKLIAAVLIVGPIICVDAFAQAAAEAVITHGTVSVGGTSAGTIVGRGAAQLGEKVGHKTSSRTAHPPMTVLRARSGAHERRPAPGLPATPESGSLVKSVEGAEHEEGLCREVSRPAANGNSAPSPAPARDCNPPADNYPSVVNLEQAR